MVLSALLVEEELLEQPYDISTAGPHAGVIHRIGNITLIGICQYRLHQGVGGKNREASVVGVIDHVNIFSDFCVVCFSRFSGGGTKYIA